MFWTVPLRSRCKSVGSPHPLLMLLLPAVPAAEEGDVYTWGWPADGRLGHSFAAGHEEGDQAPEQRCVWQPQRVELLRTVRVKQIACGGDHTMALAQDGTLFTFGSNSLAQLGRPLPGGGEHQQPRDAGAWLVNPEASCGSGMRFLRVRWGETGEEHQHSWARVDNGQRCYMVV